MKSVLTINNYSIISWNKLYSIQHWAYRKQLADEAHKLVWFEARAQEIPHFDKPVSIKITAYKKRNLIDADNVCSKLIIDGLVQAGVIDGDDAKRVSWVTTRCVRGVSNYVEMEIDDKVEL